MKKYEPADSRVKLAGLVVWIERGFPVLQLSNASLVTLAAVCAPVMNLNTENSCK